MEQHLINLGSSLIIREEEKEKISISIETIKERVKQWFGDEIIAIETFGSYSRNTILPRRVDKDSDIDIMIVFKNEKNYQPQTLLNKLREFVERKYSTSEIYQSNPTIVLELGHIKFELVPAIIDDYYGKIYKIPAKASHYLDWMTTSPNKFKGELELYNGLTSYLLKPLIRIMKYWNILNDKVYSSYELEGTILRLASVGKKPLLDHVQQIVSGLQVYELSTSKAVKVQKLKRQMDELSKKLRENNKKEAKEILLSIFPEL